MVMNPKNERQVIGHAPQTTSQSLECDKIVARIEDTMSWK